MRIRYRDEPDYKYRLFFERMIFSKIAFNSSIYQPDDDIAVAIHYNPTQDKVSYLVKRNHNIVYAIPEECYDCGEYSSLDIELVNDIYNKIEINEIHR